MNTLSAVPDQILVASANPHKIEELRQMLRPLSVTLKSTLDYPGGEEVVEDLPTLEGNALKKARYWNQFSGLPALADDTGLEVDALDGAPGVYSARYAGEKASYSDNVMKLLRELEDKPDRTARFRTVIAFVDGANEHLFEGVCSGEITESQKGEKGFGYDPVFRPAGYGKTFAELSPEEKNNISHRGLSIKAFAEFLESKKNS
ncbi:MAG: RdgB/HAM1 family non-canonical purine NTP pyrophosphatase [Balneolaceae bacterium]|nr:MAG: RdgB/HAM1 family non-canonical purine NTP pyrophosphatase [Balneolaceae bacterium]